MYQDRSPAVEELSVFLSPSSEETRQSARKCESLRVQMGPCLPPPFAPFSLFWKMLGGVCVSLCVFDVCMRMFYIRVSWA